MNPFIDRFVFFDNSSNILHDTEPPKYISFTGVFCLTQVRLQNQSMVNLFYMSEIPRQREVVEASKKIEWLDPGLNVSIEYGEDVGQFLPEVTNADMVSKQERYRILLGGFASDGEGGQRVEVLGVMEADPEAVGDRQMYTEGVLSVQPRLDVVRQYVEAIRDAHPEYAHMQLVGDVHTHPTRQDDYPEGVEPWHPSEEDIQDIVAEYKAGNILEDEPFVFGIAVQVNNETLYAFYRLVKEDDKYQAVQV